MPNVSSRAQTGAGANVHVGGFSVTGPRPKQLLIRGVGPGLANFGVAGALADPTLEVFNAAGELILANDNWASSVNLAEMRAATTAAGAFALGDASKDAALLVLLDPGSYTVQVSGVAGTTGISLVEVYEVP